MVGEEQYAKWAAYFRARPGAARAIVGINEWLKYLCYILYPALLVALAVDNQLQLLLREIAVPVILFVALSIFRHFFNAPRPYETMQIDPLIHKETRGKSFPSRHIFSIFMIAMCWLRVFVPIGIALLACGVVMAVIRVVGGVHFPRDVIVGALVAIAGGIIGLMLY